MIEGESASDLDDSGAGVSEEDGACFGGGLHKGILGLL